MTKDEFLTNLTDWYWSAYKFNNVEDAIIKRNLSVIRDAFNSCHAEFMDELFD